jgi:DNA-binding transcriptional ArsR family regulator
VPAPALDHPVDARLDGRQDLRLALARNPPGSDICIEVPLEVGQQRVLEAANRPALLERHLPERAPLGEALAELVLVEAEVDRGGGDRAAVPRNRGVLVLQGHRFAPFVRLHHQMQSTPATTKNTPSATQETPKKVDLTCDLMVTYPQTVDDDDRVFKALADPTRRHLLDRLFERDGRTLGELESELEMTRFGVMKHLRVLEDAGLVVTRRSGREKHHYLNPVPVRLIHDRWIDKYTERRVSALADLKSELEAS